MTSKPDTDKVYYLASPYSSAPPWYLKDEEVPLSSNFKKVLIDIRHKEISAIATKLMLDGYILIEPIGSCHFKQEHFELPAEYEYWKRRDRTLIEHSDGIIVAMMPGWDQSTGVTDEIKHALQLGKEVWLLSMDKYEFKTHEELFTKRLEALRQLIEESQLRGDYDRTYDGEPYDAFGG